jgi:hypothetical protein
VPFFKKEGEMLLGFPPLPFGVIQKVLVKLCLSGVVMISFYLNIAKVG